MIKTALVILIGVMLSLWAVQALAEQGIVSHDSADFAVIPLIVVTFISALVVERVWG